MKKIITKCEYIKYDSVADYIIDKQAIDYTISIDILDLMRHAMCLGDISGFKVSDFGRLFYCSFVSMFFQEDSKSGVYKVSDDYLKTETSIVSAYSFLMGMILTRYIAEKEYNIVNIFHLKDDNIRYIKTGNRYPDYFGITSNNTGYLFEAKGRKNTKLGKSTKIGKISEVNKVKQQLNQVSEVILKIKSSVSQGENNEEFKEKRYSTLDRNIISSVFSKDFRIYDIDPPKNMNNEQNDNLKIEITDKDLVCYYNDILPIKNRQSYIELEYKKRRYIGKLFDINNEFNINNQTESKKYFIGILKEIYLNIYEGENVISNHLKYMSNYESEIHSPDNISIGNDGVILVHFQDNDILLKSSKNTYINLNEL